MQVTPSQWPPSLSRPQKVPHARARVLDLKGIHRQTQVSEAPVCPVLELGTLTALSVWAQVQTNSIYTVLDC